MASKLNPYLSFNDNARQAMELYKSVLGGELSVMTSGDRGEHGEIKDLVMHSSLDTDQGYTLMGSDTPPGMEFGGGNGVVSLSGDDAPLLKGYWDGLGEGATIVMPLERQMWGGRRVGQFADRFGVTWLVNIAGEASQQG